jgi:molybdopterin synthase catalytic subunit
MKTIAGIVQETAALFSRSDHQPVTNSPVSTLVRCAIHHRLGTVPVGEPSIGTYN